MNSFRNLIIQLLIVRQFTKNYYRNSWKINVQFKSYDLIDEYI